MTINFLEVLNSQQNKFIDDQQYLYEYVQSFYKIYRTEIAYVKNYNLQYIAATTGFAKLMGVNLQEIILLQDSNMPYPIDNISKSYNKYDKDILKIKAEMSFLDINEYSTGLSIFTFYRKPIINIFTGNTLGILCYGEKYKANTLTKSFLDMHRNSCDNRYVFNHKSLTLGLKQVEVLFCILLGLREDKAIATFINNIKGSNYTKATVNNAIQELFRKFNANSRDCLLQIIVLEDYPIIIPKTLIKCGVYPINWGICFQNYNQ
ncbi:MAG: hypothetical protein KBD37_00240 [Burkholderiales bacterium]|nr:hypothetical protein [Burkholderiales bacterium]